MDTPRGPTPGGQSLPESQRAQVFELMRKTLAAINRGQAPGGELTPETVEQIARAEGATDPEQIAALLRLMGLSGDSAQAAGEPQHIVFEVAGVPCALPSQAVQNVERGFDVTPLPNVAPWVLGITQLWGTIVSVVDFAAFVGVGHATQTTRSRLLAVTVRDMQAGFLVDGVTEIRTMGGSIRRDSMAGAPEWTRPYLDGIVQDNGRNIIALDPEKLVFSDRLQRYRADERA
ncbi:MAG TPA: chemotaxis protein CheW [Ktedonobacterales bacterium]